MQGCNASMDMAEVGQLWRKGPRWVGNRVSKRGNPEICSRSHFWPLAAAALVLPVAANAQTGTAYPGVYIGAQGGANWLLNNNSYQMDTGWAAGGKVGYDFVGPRVELEGMYRSNTGTGVVAFPGASPMCAAASTRSR